MPEHFYGQNNKFIIILVVWKSFVCECVLFPHCFVCLPIRICCCAYINVWNRKFSIFATTKMHAFFSSIFFIRFRVKYIPNAAELSGRQKEWAAERRLNWSSSILCAQHTVHKIWLSSKFKDEKYAFGVRMKRECIANFVRWISLRPLFFWCVCV